MRRSRYLVSCGVIALLAAHLIGPAHASSHQDAALIIRDPSANTTDVYAFVQNENGTKSLVTALGVYPHEEPGIGPNKYNFDDNVLYQVNVATVGDVAAGRATLIYEFNFNTTFRNQSGGYFTFAGQRDDGFYADMNAIFDLLQLRSPGKDSQGGFNIHMMALVIPVSELGGDQQIVGVYATTSRRQMQILRDETTRLVKNGGPELHGPWVQVARQGNPLFNEGLVAIADKDRYSRTSPASDNELFSGYAMTPELAHLINVIIFNGQLPDVETGRTDIAGIFIPDLIKVDLSTDPCRLAGNGTQQGPNPDDAEIG